MPNRGILKEHAGALHAALYLADWVMIAASAWLAHGFYLGTFDVPGRYGLVIIIALLLSLWLFPRFSLYQTWRSASVLDEARNITLAWGGVLLILTALAFSTKTGAEYSRGWLGLWAMLGWGALITARLAVRLGLRELRQRGFNLRHIVIVGSGGLAAEVVARLRSAPWMGLNVAGFFPCDTAEKQAGLDDVPLLGGLDQLAEYVTNHSIDQVWLAMPLREEEKVKWLLHELRNSTVDIRFVPDLFGMRLLNHSIMDVAGLPVMNLSVSPMAGLNQFLKAVEDRLLALLILLLISPLLLLLSIGVKLSSPGPIFYRQERVGWNGGTFNMLKFRSMPVDTDKGVVQWGNAEQKVNTRFGAFIRRTSLDELPQFINVLLGDMSIVGPRPERTVFVEKFKDEIPDYMKKHMVKAGITGWAQVNGWRGDTDLTKRIEYDLYYIEHWSVWFDLKIILLTIFKGFVHENAK
ncbi:MAG TPA: undecaprenyl-phosphate glucose phosphotransferase [Gammaproteobacteria bacterium]